jgi:hypothetical protein
MLMQIMTVYLMMPYVDAARLIKDGDAIRISTRYGMGIALII